ncbi:MAG: SdpI family protein [Oscillospiraceae bacterium]|nr:SdpI family protein [Oscillospiraceae bacterium]
MKNKRTLILTTLLCLLPMLVGLAVYGRLPERMATHWGLHGEVNGWSSRAFAVFGLPLIVAALNVAVYFGMNADPKRGNMSPALRLVCQWICPVVSVLAGGLTIAWGLGYELRIERIMPIFVGLVFVIIGNYLPKTKQSYTLGIRLPWTLNSEENWNRTHRLAGFLWVLGGLYFIVMSFVGWTPAGFLVPVLLMVLIPAVYSYMLYKKGI